jgi:hypothetical protein
MISDIVCRRCGETIQEPVEIECIEGICIRCIDEMAEDVDESVADEFELADIDNEERRFMVI